MRRLRDSELTPELIAKASQVLRSTMSAALGSSHRIEANGKSYLARIETHYNAQKGNHRGITLYEESAPAVLPPPLPDADTILAVAGIERTTPEFRRALIAMCRRLGAHQDNMATVMSFETAGTFNPAEPNRAGSHAVGLIQFMPKTAREQLGTTTEALAKMSAVEQLFWVEKYFQPYRPALKTLEGCYLSVFYPRARNMNATQVIAEIGSKTYEQNKGFDRDRDGDIEVQEVCRTIYEVRARAGGRRISISAHGSSFLPPPLPLRPTLRRGSTGLAVVEWQRVIGVTPDGEFQSKTVQATIAWQRTEGLKDDGIVGAKSWAVAIAKRIA